MDALSLSSEKFDVECDCGRSVSRTIAQWQRNSTMECPQCGVTIKVDVSGMAKSIHNVDRGLERLDRTIGNLGS
jgi:predicted RNA-binding Zn-ribbon protein involved in translation (DUF1610 family)